MISPFPTTVRRVHPRAFTLVELLVVLAIIAVIATVIIPSIGPLLRSYNLNRASSMLTNELTFARQAALTRNADVEVRFYQIGSTTYTAGSPFQAFRSFLANATTPTQAVGLDKISYLPGQVIISSAPDPSNTPYTFSTLLDDTNHSTVLSTGADTLPGGTSTTAYVSFLFRATGGTNLVPVTSLWYLTVYSGTGTSLPSNYVTIQIDPVTGNERTYRP